MEITQEQRQILSAAYKKFRLIDCMANDQGVLVTLNAWKSDFDSASVAMAIAAMIESESAATIPHQTVEIGQEEDEDANTPSPEQLKAKAVREFRNDSVIPGRVNHASPTSPNDSSSLSEGLERWGKQATELLQKRRQGIENFGKRQPVRTIARLTENSTREEIRAASPEVLRIAMRDPSLREVLNRKLRGEL